MRWGGWLGVGIALWLAACTPAGPSQAGAAARPTPAAAEQAPGGPTSGAATAAAGGAAASASTAPLSPPVALKVGSTLTLGDSPLFVAMAKGYFQAEGLDVELVPFDSGANMIAPLAAGQLDAGVGATSAGLFNAMARDVGLVIVSGAGQFTAGHGSSVVMARKDLVDSGQIRDYADLRGRTIATSGEGNVTTIAIGKALERGGLTRDDANVVSMGFPDMLSAFAGGSLDVGFEAEPFVTNAVERNLATRWKPVDEILPDHMVTVWMYSQKLIQTQPEAARRLMVALVRGSRDYMDAIDKGRGRAEVVAAITEHSRVKDPALYDRMVFIAVPTSGEVDVKSLADDIAWYQANGYLEAAPDLSRSVDGRFAAYARERLGPYQ
ncbi:MAG TPA: ABC transporter substrate-binding protein [Chloroflexota bacterium]|nr:ABC transporter substrate-binding protein [Chloroflexota bacterium]